eukprot:767839-Rhodomonas_salina.1
MTRTLLLSFSCTPARASARNSETRSHQRKKQGRIAVSPRICCVAAYPRSVPDSTQESSSIGYASTGQRIASAYADSSIGWISTAPVLRQCRTRHSRCVAH